MSELGNDFFRFADMLVRAGILHERGDDVSARGPVILRVGAVGPARGQGAVTVFTFSSVTGQLMSVIPERAP